MQEEHRLTEVDPDPGHPGVRVVTERMDSVRSVALGFWIGTGSVGEATDEAGLSHLVEHMLFRGTDRFESLEIDQLFDAMGAELNAGTGKETTSVYTRVIDEHLDEAFDVMADMVWRPRFAAEDLDNEREIVLEEIAMYEDDPQDKVFDVLGEAVFGGHPLGRPIIGRAEVVGERGGRPAVRLPHARYVPGNVVVAAAGNRRPRRARRAGHADAARARRKTRLRSCPARPRASARGRCSSPSRPSRCTSASARPASPATTSAASRCACSTTSSAGPSSSRLFQEVREERGLAYAVYSFQSHVRGHRPGRPLRRHAPGQRRRGHARRGRRARAPARRARRPPRSSHRAKENVKGRMVLALESTAARMNRLGSSVLAGMPLLTVDEVVERIEAVTLDDLAELAAALLAPERLSAAGIGGDEAAFRAALEPVSGALVESAA